MQLAFALLLCLGATLAVPQHHVKPSVLKPAALPEDLTEIFVDNIDLVKLVIVLLSHLADDAALAAVLDHIKSDAFQTYCATLGTRTYEQSLSDFLLGKGVDAGAGLSALNGIILGAEPAVSPDQTASLVPFLDDFLSCVDVDNLVAVMEDKLLNSPDFQDLWVQITKESAHQAFNDILADEEALDSGALLEGVGVDVKGIIIGVYHVFGWGDPPIG